MSCVAALGMTSRRRKNKNGSLQWVLVFDFLLFTFFNYYIFIFTVAHHIRAREHDLCTLLLTVETCHTSAVVSLLFVSYWPVSAVTVAVISFCVICFVCLASLKEKEGKKKLTNEIQRFTRNSFQI